MSMSHDLVLIFASARRTQLLHSWWCSAAQRCTYQCPVMSCAMFHCIVLPGAIKCCAMLLGSAPCSVSPVCHARRCTRCTHGCHLNPHTSRSEDSLVQIHFALLYYTGLLVPLLFALCSTTLGAMHCAAVRSTWNSTCRGRMIAFSTYTPSLPNAAPASERACWG